MLNLTRTTGLDFSLELFFWLRFSGLQGEHGHKGQCQGSSWELQLPPQGGAHWSRTVGSWEHHCWCSSLTPPPWAGHALLSSFLSGGGVTGADRVWGAGDLCLVSTQGTSSAAGDWLPISVIENSTGSQKLPTADLLMTGVVVLGNSLGCLWVSSPFSKKKMILNCWWHD